MEEVDRRWSGWVWVGECFFWYRPTRVVPDKGLLSWCQTVCTFTVRTHTHTRVTPTWRLKAVWCSQLSEAASSGSTRQTWFTGPGHFTGPTHNGQTFCLSTRCCNWVRALLDFIFISISVFLSLSCLQCYDAVGWAAGRHPACKKTEWWGAVMVICLERGADLHMAQLMPLPLTVSCFSEIQIGFTFLVPAHLGSPRKKAVKRV